MSCQNRLEHNSINTIYRDITNCLDLLNANPTQKQYVKQCHLVLSSILNDIKNKKQCAGGHVRINGTSSPGQDSVRSAGYTSEPSPKRRKTRRTKGDEIPEEATNQPHYPSQEVNQDVKRHGSLDSNTIAPKEASQAAPFPSLLNMANAAPHSYTSQTWATPQIIPSAVDHAGMVNSTCADPEAFGFSDNYLPQVQVDGADPNYWSNFDVNAADVFESAAWENLIGSTEPDMSPWAFRV